MDFGTISPADALYALQSDTSNHALSQKLFEASAHDARNDSAQPLPDAAPRLRPDPSNVPFTNQLAFQELFTPTGFNYESPFAFDSANGVEGNAQASGSRSTANSQPVFPSGLEFGNSLLPAPLAPAASANSLWDYPLTGMESLNEVPISAVNLATGDRFTQLLEQKLGLDALASPAFSLASPAFHLPNNPYPFWPATHHPSTPAAIDPSPFFTPPSTSYGNAYGAASSNPLSNLLAIDPLAIEQALRDLSQVQIRPDFDVPAPPPFLLDWMQDDALFGGLRQAPQAQYGLDQPFSESDRFNLAGIGGLVSSSGLIGGQLPTCSLPTAENVFSGADLSLLCGGPGPTALCGPSFGVVDKVQSDTDVNMSLLDSIWSIPSPSAAVPSHLPLQTRKVPGRALTSGAVTPVGSRPPTSDGREHSNGKKNALPPPLQIRVHKRITPSCPTSRRSRTRLAGASRLASAAKPAGSWALDLVNPDKGASKIWASGMPMAGSSRIAVVPAVQGMDGKRICSEGSTPWRGPKRPETPSSDVDEKPRELCRKRRRHTASECTRVSSSAKKHNPARVDVEDKKIIIACHMCRARKLKCDGARPKCHHCTRRNEQGCEYDAILRRRGPGRKATETKGFTPGGSRWTRKAGMRGSTYGNKGESESESGQGDSAEGDKGECEAEQGGSEAQAEVDHLEVKGEIISREARRETPKASFSLDGTEDQGGAHGHCKVEVGDI